MTGFSREISRLLVGFILAFAAIILFTAGYAIFGSLTLLSRDDNPRLVEAERSIQRGRIYDRQGVLLASTTRDNNGFAVRNYGYPAMNSGLGYYSYRYGTSGAEAAYNDRLSGANRPDTITQVVLSSPKTGDDIQLTLDLSTQLATTEAMQGHTGGAVIMAVPSGEILALVSLPTFDANTLDANWDTLIQAEDNPFFHRILQGQYQPGSLFQSVVTISALMHNQPLTTQYPGGTRSITLNDLTIGCVQPHTSFSISLREAFLYGCPRPFVQVAPLIGVSAIRGVLNQLQFDTPPTLEGFVAQPDNTNLPFISRSNLRENVLGQGDVRFSPMAVNALTAAIINGGNTIPPVTLAATRPPNTDTWAPVRHQQPSTPYITAQTARRMGELMRISALEGTAGGIQLPGYDVGAHAAVAYSGESSLIWLTGFAILEDEQDLVFTIVIEDEQNTQVALDIATAAIQAASETLTAP